MLFLHAEADLPLHEGAKACEGVVPLSRDAVEIGAHLADPIGLEGVVAFPPDFGGADQAGLFQHVQMLRHRLPGECGTD
ncbi:hypothetical protein SAMN05216228_1014118 [Rhizobium tibeticum]|uniref:Uncharacterized protein n=1 Tax=Rhizobium tibeticum TaxID=501024 RepID=A0A1H8NFI4_9HYPH|nr:hypothetical protein RTCCBAU85039_3293 [Rhizobium tibeticum]SEO28380.1 hypothetical protein SAMN05216228_1014118 [Rhizobium tibeticum]